MKAILTRYCGPTKTRGSRVIVSDSDGNRIVRAWNSALESEDNFRAGARALLDKMGWRGTYYGGYVRGGMVWVCSEGAPIVCRVSKSVKKGNRS